MSLRQSQPDTDGNKSEYDIIKVPKENLDLLLETLYLDSQSSSFDKELKNDITKALESIEYVSELLLSKLEDKHVFGSDKVDPENMPTCDGCGGQKEHPTKEFSYPPVNGLCANELDECERLTDGWTEGLGCPFCDDDNSDYHTETEGGGHDDFIRHNYQCGTCEKEWFVEGTFSVHEVK